MYANARKLIKQTEYSIKHANKLIVFSEYIKKEILYFFKTINPKKIYVVYPGLDHVNIPTAGLANYKAHKKQNQFPYFLYVGVLKRIKNCSALFSFFYDYVMWSKNYELKLLLIGRSDGSYLSELKKDFLYQRISDKIIFLHDLTDTDLINYYRNALLVLNFSLEEGFCFPVLEALTLEKNVIVNDLKLYDEFKPYYPKLIVYTSNKNTFKKILTIIDRAKSIKPVSNEYFRSKFTWDRFTQNIYQIMLKR